MRSKVIGIFVDKEIQDSAVPVQGVTFAPRDVESAPANFPKFRVHKTHLDHGGGDHIGPRRGWLSEAPEFLNLVLYSDRGSFIREFSSDQF